MKKNFKTLTKELNVLTDLTSKPINIYTSSIFSIMQYKSKLRMKKKLETKLMKLNKQKIKFTNNIDKKIDKIFKDTKVSCRKYCRIQPSLIYKKEKFLYKFGYISTKPVSPIRKAILSKLSPITEFSKSIISKLPFHKINPKENITNLAIHTTKQCIRGYQKIADIKCSAKSNILQSSLVKKLLYIKNEALRQLEDEKTNQKHDESNEFLERIKLKPNQMSDLSNIPSHTKSKDPITHAQSL